MRKPSFEASLGVFGDDGWKRVYFRRWLPLWVSGLYVVRVRWLEKRPPIFHGGKP